MLGILGLVTESSCYETIGNVQQSSYQLAGVALVIGIIIGAFLNWTISLNSQVQTMQGNDRPIGLRQKSQAQEGP